MKPLLLSITLATASMGGSAAAQTVAPFPFTEGFESGSLAPYWKTTITGGTGQAQVTTANGPYSGIFHLTLDGNSGTDVTIWQDLAIDLDGESGVLMEFAWRDYSDEYDAGTDGIFISDDGVNFTKVMDLNGGTAGEAYKLYTLDLDKAVVDAGMGYTTPFYIRLGWSDEFTIPTDGFGFDDISIRSLGYTTLGLVTSKTPTFSGEFGTSATSVADLDGDGFRELVVGHPKFNGSSGRVEIFSGKTYEYMSSVTQNKGGDQFGQALASVGDLDGDGFDELLVGARFNDTAAFDAGAAFVYSSKTGALLHTFTGTLGGDHFGSAVASVPDLTGDGIAELFVGAPQADGANGADSGQGFVFSGADYSLLFTLEGPQVGAYAGAAVDALGDMTGDGVPDLVMGAPEYDLLPVLNDRIGAAFIYSGADGSLVRTFKGDVQASQFGSALAVTEDLTGDGLLDLAVGAPDHKNTAGLVRFFDSATGALLKEVDGLKISDRFGASVTRAGDVDGDGTNEIAVGTDGALTTVKGYVRGYSGANLDESFDFEPVGGGAGFGAMVQGLGDMNGDGLSDLAIGSPRETAGGQTNAGAVRVVSTAGAPEVTSVTGVHSTLSGDAVVHGTNLLGNLTAKVDGVSRPVTFVSPVEALVSLPPDEPGGFHSITVGTDLGGVTLPEGLVRYPAIKAPSTLALGDNLTLDLDNGEPGAYVLAFSNMKYAAPAPFENFGWYWGLELNGVWLAGAGSFVPGATAVSLSLPGTTSTALLGTPFYVQAWTFQSELGLAGFTNTIDTTIVP